MHLNKRLIEIWHETVNCVHYLKKFKIEYLVFEILVKSRLKFELCAAEAQEASTKSQD